MGTAGTNGLRYVGENWWSSSQERHRQQERLNLGFIWRKVTVADKRQAVWVIQPLSSWIPSLPGRTSWFGRRRSINQQVVRTIHATAGLVFHDASLDPCTRMTHPSREALLRSLHTSARTTTHRGTRLKSIFLRGKHRSRGMEGENLKRGVGNIET